MKSGMSSVAAMATAAGLASACIQGSALAQPVMSTAHQWVIDHGISVLRGMGGGDAAGPDVIVGEIHSSQSSTGSMTVTISPSAGTPLNGIAAYGLGTSSCNIGTANLNWIANSPNHPVIPQNMYRLKTVNGSTRFEQLGQSWMKFAFTALTYNACNNEGYSCNGQGGSVLGVGCSDPYTASRNATQTSLGPRYTTNPFTGAFPDGTSAWRTANWPATVNALSKRLQVAVADMDPANNAGALYFGEAIYVTPDDAAAGNGANNASYRRITITPSTWVLTLVDSTQRRKAAINAWKDCGLGIGQPDPNVMLTDVNALPLDGYVTVGSKATDLGGGVWHYEYAVENRNSDRGIGSFTVNFPAGTQISNAEMRMVLQHSGIAAEDADRNTAWSQTINTSNIAWSTNTVYSAATPTLGSYIRWGTMYNFRFDANVAPTNSGAVSMDYYKPGTPTSITAAAWVPGASTAGCYANCDGSTTAPFLSVNDFSCFLNRYAAGDPAANCDGSSVAPILNVNDFICFNNLFAAGCANP